LKRGSKRVAWRHLSPEGGVKREAGVTALGGKEGAIIDFREDAVEKVASVLPKL